MSWLAHHRRSEDLAAQAEIALLEGKPQEARRLYGAAAVQEEQALEYLRETQTRTLGITVVSAAALHAKSGDARRASCLAQTWLNSGRLPGFAQRQLAVIMELQASQEDLPETT